jgi:hypothetical protein
MKSAWAVSGGQAGKVYASLRGLESVSAVAAGHRNTRWDNSGFTYSAKAQLALANVTGDETGKSWTAYWAIRSIASYPGISAPKQAC